MQAIKQSTAIFISNHPYAIPAILLIGFVAFSLSKLASVLPTIS